jgi:hypothetical protein
MKYMQNQHTISFDCIFIINKIKTDGCFTKILKSFDTISKQRKQLHNCIKNNYLAYLNLFLSNNLLITTCQNTSKQKNKNC